jgi:hypothetical protein
MSTIDFSDPGIAAFRGEHNAEVLDEWLGIASDGIGSLATDEWAARQVARRTDDTERSTRS